MDSTVASWEGGDDDAVGGDDAAGDYDVVGDDDAAGDDDVVGDDDYPGDDDYSGDDDSDGGTFVIPPDGAGAPDDGVEGEGCANCSATTAGRGLALGLLGPLLLLAPRRRRPQLGHRTAAR
jgi:hypothetical protein